MSDVQPERALPSTLDLNGSAQRVPPNGEGQRPAWQRPTVAEHRWPAAVAILVAVALQRALPDHLALPPRWALPGLELALFVAVVAGNPMRMNRETAALRLASRALLVLASLATAASVVRLVGFLLASEHLTAPPILLNGGIVWLTNVIVFALWYWESDRGGPAARAKATRTHPDFLFAQMTVPHLVHRDWEPRFTDYLYLSFTNSTAFSPTDTLPLSRWAKLAMMAQSAVALVTIALVIARAVNIMGN